MASTDKHPAAARTARTHRLTGSREPTAPQRPAPKRPASEPLASEPLAPEPPEPDPPEPTIRVKDIGELVASVPALIGFHPRESLVMIAMGGRSGRRIGLALRVDLPPLQDRDAVVADAVRGLLLDEPSGAVVIVFSAGSHARSDARSAALPHVELVGSVAATLGRHGVDAHASIWAESTVAGAPWACYDTCRCSGVLPDPASTTFAASVVASGQVIHRDRAALQQLVAPPDAARIRRREALMIARLDEAVRRPEAVSTGFASTGSAGAGFAGDESAGHGSAFDSSGLDGPAFHRSGLDGPAAGLALVDAAIAATAEGGLDLDDDAVLDLACALSEPEVRDTALLRNIGPAAAAAEQLWTVLVREMPDPEAAEPAAMLAVSALLRGDGALANVALERAEQAWPGHRLTGLLRVAADVGMRPAQVRSWLAGPAPSARRAGPERRIR